MAVKRMKYISSHLSLMYVYIVVIFHVYMATETNGYLQVGGKMHQEMKFAIMLLVTDAQKIDDFGCTDYK